MGIIATARVVQCPPRWLLVRLETSEGIIGWGEAIGDLHEEVEAALNRACQQLIGMESSRITEIQQHLLKGRFWRDGPILATTSSAIEIALWDIKGKELGAPIYELLGGKVRERVKVYRNLWGRNPKEFAGSAIAAVSEGLNVAKLSPAGPTEGIVSDSKLIELIASIKAVREATNPDFAIAVDLHGRLSPSTSRRLLPLLDDSDLLFIEEADLASDPVLLKSLRQTKRDGYEGTRTPMATGERLLKNSDFVELLKQKGAVDIIQPDLSLVGGIKAGHILGELAQSAQISLAPHCPYGPIQFAASIQVAACTKSHVLQEFQSLGGAGKGGGNLGSGQNWEFNLLKIPFEVKDGMVEVPSEVGLGIEVDEEAIKAHMGSWNPHPPTVWRTMDGAVAEW